MNFKLLPYRFKILGEALILGSLISLLVVAFAFPMDVSTFALQMAMSLFLFLCYAGIIILIFSKERVENETTMKLRFRTMVIVAILYFTTFVALDIYRIWVPGSEWKVYLSILHTIPFVYYLLFRILYRNQK